MPVTPETPGWKIRLVAVCGLLLSSVSLSATDAVIERQYSESREPCAEFAPLKRPFFGDLHVHTRYSLDASTQGTRTTPSQAYGFAQGESVGIQPWSKEGEPLRSLQLARPLDFAMISDHAELIGEVHMCNTPGVEGHDSWNACSIAIGRAGHITCLTPRQVSGQRTWVCAERMMSSVKKRHSCPGKTLCAPRSGITIAVRIVHLPRLLAMNGRVCSPAAAAICIVTWCFAMLPCRSCL